MIRLINKFTMVMGMLFAMVLIPVSAFAQQPIEPIVNCVEYDKAADLFTVHFGYINPNDVTVVIPLGKNNKITPAPQDRGQPTSFEPGVHNNAFSAEFNGNDLTWHIESENYKPKDATASAIDTKCGFVQGIVTDDRTGFPLVGVTVTVKNTAITATTAYDGTYSLEAQGGDDILIFELEKYFTEEVDINFASQVNMELVPDPAFLQPLFAYSEGDDLWPELFYLADQVEAGESIESNDIFQIENGNVLIEVIANVGADITQLQAVLVNLGFYDEVPNNTPLILTGYFPAINLKQLNNYDELINFVRPGYPPITNSGLATSQGDVSMQSNIIRGGFGVSGSGVKIGVISDSYDAQGNTAATVVEGGDLPGSEKSGNLTPVDVLKDNVRGSNEGMGMMEIIHDVAPGAQLGFRTGFLSSSDMALGIVELVDADYDVIVDDITYLSEPFTPTGQISQAVEYAASKGTHYLSSAGNFGGLSHVATFAGTADIPDYPFLADNDLAHQFAAGDHLQQASLEAGVYVIEMQWLDKFYSQGDPTGAAYDLDIWVLSQTGNLLYSGNRENTGEDPIEIVAFKINEPTIVDIIISGENIPTGLTFQYMILRGQGWTFDEHQNQGSTVLGHAASDALSSVGAVFYGFTPEYNEDPSTWKANTTSSNGGNLLGEVRAKPDFLAADGTNTVSFGTDVNFDSDNFPNFFGTSAAAPHAAAVMGLVLESLDKYYDTSEEAIKSEISTVGLRSLLATKALDLGTGGFDYQNGNGLIRGKAILSSLANPSPSDLEILEIPEGITPGQDTFTLTLSAKYLSDDTRLFLRNEELVISNTQIINDSVTVFEAVIGPFVGNPALFLETPPKEGTNGTDGGQSDPAYLLTPSITTVIVKANEANKKYGEVFPDFSYTLSPELSEAEMELLPELVYTTNATTSSEIGTYFITPSFGIDAEGDTITAPGPLTEIYEFVFEDGALFVEPLPLTITPNNLHITYGEKLPEITFSYSFGVGFNLFDSLDVVENIASAYQQQLVSDTIALLDRGLAVVNRGLAVVNGTAWTISETALNRGLAVVNRGLAVVNGNNAFLIDAALIEAYAESNSGTFVNRGLAVVNADILANGQANIQILDENGDVIENRGLAVVNRGLAVVNEEVSGDSNGKTIMIVDESDSDIGDFSSINYVTGLSATTDGEPQYIIPGAFYNRNFLIEYGYGELYVDKVPLSLVVDDTYTNSDSIPAFTYSITGFVGDENFEEVFGEQEVTFAIDPAFTGEPGVYEVVPTLSDPLNYSLTLESGQLYVNPVNGSRIRVWMECMEYYGAQYKVYFSYENKNDVAWYIPRGENNQIIGTEDYESELPEVFQPGIHVFAIVFDGSNIYWTLTSSGTNKSSRSATESINSEGCLLSLSDLGSGYTIAPNPTQDYVTVGFKSSNVEGATITVYNESGTVIYPNYMVSSTDQTITIDLTSYQQGVYYISIQDEYNSIYTQRIYKE